MNHTRRHRSEAEVGVFGFQILLIEVRFSMDSISRHCRSWCDLPTELLEKIWSCLKSSHSDTLRFRSICRSWRSSAPLLPTRSLSPLIIPCPFYPNYDLDPDDDPDEDHFYIQKTSTIYSIRPLSDTTTPPWIVEALSNVEIQYYKETRSLELRNTFRRRRLPVPRPSTMFPAGDGDGTCVFPQVINLLDFEVIEIGSHNCLSADYESILFAVELNMQLAFASGHHCKTGDGRVTVLGVENINGELGFWGTGDEKWIFFSDHTITGVHFDCVVYIHIKFYAIARNGLAVTIDPDSLKVTQVVPPKQYEGFFHLISGNIFGVSYDDEDDVDSDDELEGRVERRFRVERLEEEAKEWVRTDDEMKDRVGFIAPEYAFLALAKDLPGYKSNSIYYNRGYNFYSEHDFPPVSCGHLYSVIDIHELENGRITPLCKQDGCSQYLG